MLKVAGDYRRVSGAFENPELSKNISQSDKQLRNITKLGCKLFRLRHLRVKGAN